jgi:predicted glycosyltransferase/peptidoglycan/xylan/chitin deacetylase (PgdA/CDA1 family)
VKKKIMFYCQHVLGMGHLVRSMALVEGLSREFDVCFVNGGEIIQGFNMPGNIRLENLPPLTSDQNFTQLAGSDGQSLAEIQDTRLRQLTALYETFQPDIVVIELFPFGRKKFASELIPLLARIRLDGKSKVVCSLRDILVQKRDQEKHEASVCSILNRYFDLVLIHADPTFQRLEETFAALHHINIPVRYTGYVIQPTAVVDEVPVLLNPELPLLLGSIGGGRVGVELLEACIEASTQLAERFAHQLLLFTGPYLPDEQWVNLNYQIVDQPHIILQRYTANFLSYMQKAKVSISMAGYNTCMNILSTSAQALVLPFSGGGNDEQGLRAKKLEDLGLLGVLDADDLSGRYLAEKILQRLEPQMIRTELNLAGVESTTQILQGLSKTPTPKVLPKLQDYSLIESVLRPALQRLQTTATPCSIFMRDDDIDQDEDTLRQLCDVVLSKQLPLHVAIIPNTLTPAGIRVIKDAKRAYGENLELGQHGWQHLNHETSGRNCEFGPSRSFTEQLGDIASGKALLEDVFMEQFSPIFTPPWNRCTLDTHRALDQLGFKVFSKDTSHSSVTGYRFKEVSTTLDLYTWKEGANMKPPHIIITEIIRQLTAGETVGLLLHHKVMDADAFNFLDALLSQLKRYSFIQFRTLQQLASVASQPERVLA